MSLQTPTKRTLVRSWRLMGSWMLIAPGLGSTHSCLRASCGVQERVVEEEDRSTRGWRTNTVWPPRAHTSLQLLARSAQLRIDLAVSIGSPSTKKCAPRLRSGLRNTAYLSNNASPLLVASLLCRGRGHETTKSSAALSKREDVCSDLSVSSNNGDRKVAIVIDSSGSMACITIRPTLPPRGG